MMVLTRQEKKNIASPWVKKVFKDAAKAANLSLSDLEPAIQITEDWFEDNQASFVAELPEPFKAKTNGLDKALLFAYTAMKRAGLI